MSVLLPENLPTPATIILADRLERNLATMAALATGLPAALRPHAKTHKCREIVRLQRRHGARGISVATVGEAEILTGAQADDVDDVFIAYPLWADPDQVDRLRALAERAVVCVGVDSPAAAVRLAPLAGRVRALVEVDCGLHRSGVAPSVAGAVASAIARAGLEVAGAFTYPGQSYRPGAGAQSAEDERIALAEAAESLRSAGFEPHVLSGGSTPSIRHARPGSLNEIRPGVYVFNDAQQVELGTVTIEEVALVAAATVVSRPTPTRAVLDAGSKVLGSDRPAWTTGYGRLLAWPEARIEGLWEHHAVVTVGEPGPELGEVVAVVPNHVCTAVNLVPDLLVVDDGQVVDRWPVAARAANR